MWIMKNKNKSCFWLCAQGVTLRSQQPDHVFLCRFTPALFRIYWKTALAPSHLTWAPKVCNRIWCAKLWNSFTSFPTEKVSVRLYELWVCRSQRPSLKPQRLERLMQTSRSLSNIQCDVWCSCRMTSLSWLMASLGRCRKGHDPMDRGNGQLAGGHPTGDSFRVSQQCHLHWFATSDPAPDSLLENTAQSPVEARI